MKTVFDKPTRDELVSRINALTESNTAQWGKMNVGQMVKHCALWEEMLFGNKKYKHAFIGRLFGKKVLRDLVKDERPLMRNTPTLPELKIAGDIDLAAEKKRWIAMIEAYAHFEKHDFVHPFFGKMTNGQIGLLAYKHADHHLRQFNG